MNYSNYVILQSTTCYYLHVILHYIIRVRAQSVSTRLARRVCTPLFSVPLIEVLFLLLRSVVSWPSRWETPDFLAGTPPREGLKLGPIRAV